MERAERRWRQKRKWLSRMKEQWNAYSNWHYIRNGKKSDIVRCRTFQDFLMFHKQARLSRHTVTPIDRSITEKNDRKQEKRRMRYDGKRLTEMDID